MAPESDNRLLILVGEFAPAIAGGVYRPAALAKYAARLGWVVTVLTGPEPKTITDAGLKLLEYVGPEVSILRVAPSELKPSARLFPRVDGGLLTALDMVDLARNSFRGNLPRTIVASGPPFCSFVAGFLLARQKGIRLIIEYRDEWTECPFEFVSKDGANQEWETKCLERANVVCFTTNSQQVHQVERFSIEPKTKAIVVPNGWEPSEVPNLTSKVEACNARRVLTFAGKLGGHTDPGPFLDALLDILQRRPDLRGRLKFKFVGAKRADALKRLINFPFQDVIDLIPVVPLAEATRLMRASDALLLFHDARFERYLPGKLYEYIAAEVPIFLFDDQGESASLIDELGVGRNLMSADVGGIEAALNDIVHEPSRASRQRVENDVVDKWLAKHARENLVMDFLSMIAESIVDGDKAELATG